jgi:molybdopterin/thiamine biosynthesis adenylyltransferase
MLTDFEKARYEWQMWTPGVGEAGQERLKRARVLISRGGGVGGTVALQLAAAGVGTIHVAHGGELQPSDLNRQLLMTHDHVGKPRRESIERRLRELNPLVEVRAFDENVSEANADRLVGEVDLVVDCAPLFPERYAMNRAAMAQGKPMVECAMFDGEAYVTVFLPGRTGCLACLHPEAPPEWRRQFPVFGAVSGAVACLGAYEVIKYLTGTGESLAGTLLHCDLARMRFRRLPLARNPNCPACPPLREPAES